MVNLTINPKRKTEAVITTAAILLLCFAAVNFAKAQTFSPPQIPNYNAPSNNNPDNGITIPDQPSNEGAPNTNNISPTSTPAPQTDYTPIAIAIIIVAIIAAAIIAWTVNQKRKSSLLSPPPN